MKKLILQTFVRRSIVAAGKGELTPRQACDSKLVNPAALKAAQRKLLPGYVDFRSLLGR